jgi:cytochrome P450
MRLIFSSFLTHLLDFRFFFFFFFFGLTHSHDTTSILVSWAVYLLTIHPEYCAQVVEEVDATFAVPPTGSNPPTMEQLNSLKVTYNVLRETLRLYPPASGARIGTAGQRIGPYDVNGITLFPVTYAIHRNKAVWGEDAMEFKPERWEKITPAQLAAWAPFSKVCSGFYFVSFGLASLHLADPFFLFLF